MELLPKVKSVLLDTLTKTIKQHILKDEVDIPENIVHMVMDSLGLSRLVTRRFLMGFNKRNGAMSKYKK